MRNNHLTTLGAHNYTEEDRETNDYYATDPVATYGLLDNFTFNNEIWEPACGEGAISEILKEEGYKVKSTDLIDRGGYPDEILNFLNWCWKDSWDGDIITNPPYKLATEFIEKAIETVKYGNHVAMFLKLQFLEGKERRKLFEKYPPKYIYVSSSRLTLAKNGEFEKYKGKNAVAYAWFIWEKGFNGEPTLRWFN